MLMGASWTMQVGWKWWKLRKAESHMCIYCNQVGAFIAMVLSVPVILSLPQGLNVSQERHAQSKSGSGISNLTASNRCFCSWTIFLYSLPRFCHVWGALPTAWYLSFLLPLSKWTGPRILLAYELATRNNTLQCVRIYLCFYVQLVKNMCIWVFMQAYKFCISAYI